MEDQIQKIITSKPRFFMAGPDDRFKVLYGCETTEGKSSYVVNEAEIFAGYPKDESNAEQNEAWRHEVAKRIGTLRGALLWNCLGKLVAKEMINDPRVGEFVWTAIHGPAHPEVIEIPDFISKFDSSAKEGSSEPEATTTA
jgi:hypothetical protein